MKVLLWSIGFWPTLGGLETITCELVQTLRTKGVEFEIITATPGPPQWNGVPVHRFPMERMALHGSFEQQAQLQGRLRRLLRNFRPDVIHLNGIGGGVLSAIFVLRGYPTLLTLHGSWGHWRPPAIVSLLGEVDWVAACSAHTLAEVRDYDSSLHSRSTLIRNALPKLNETEDVPFSDSEFDKTTPYFLCAGRMNPEKGYRLALRALRELPNEVRLKLAGDGASLEGLRTFAESLGVKERVDFLGRVDSKRLYHLMRHARALVCPSFTEGFGLVALEASRVGCPVIASRVGGLPEVVKDRESGFLLNSREPGELAGHLSFLLKNPERARQLGRNGRQRASVEFRWSDFVNSYESLYEKLCSGEPLSRTPSPRRTVLLRALFQRTYHRVHQTPGTVWGIDWLEEREVEPETEPLHYEANYRVAGETVRVRASDSTLLAAWDKVWTPTGPSAPDFEIALTSAEQPRLGFLPATERPERWKQMGGLTHPKDSVLAYHRPGLVGLLDRRSARFVGAAKRSAQLLPSERGKPLLLPLLVRLADRDLRVFHGSVVSREGQGCLIVGPEDSGKTGTLLTLLQLGWDFVADDLLVSHDQKLGPLYHTIWMSPETVKSFYPSLESAFCFHDAEKKGYLSITDSPFSTVEPTTIKYVLVCHRSQETFLTSCHPMEAMTALLPSSFGKLPGIQDQRKLSKIAKVLNHAQCFTVSLGKDANALIPHLTQLE